MKIRREVINYMEHFRDDFQPFVPDDMPFDRYSMSFLV